MHERRTVTGSAQLEARLQQVLSQLDAGSPLGLRIRIRIRLAGESDYFHGEHAAIVEMLGEARAAGDPRATAGLWHQIPAGNETLRVHRRFFSDIETADAAAAMA